MRTGSAAPRCFEEDPWREFRAELRREPLRTSLLILRLVSSIYIRGLVLACRLRFRPIGEVVTESRSGRARVPAERHAAERHPREGNEDVHRTTWIDRVLRARSSRAGGARRTARLIDSIFRPLTLPFAGRCLVVSLLVFRVLQSVEPAARLHVGFRFLQPTGELDGHAWVTVRGRPLLDRDREAAEIYRSAYRIPGEGR